MVRHISCSYEIKITTKKSSFKFKIKYLLQCTEKRQNSCTRMYSELGRTSLTSKVVVGKITVQQKIYPVGYLPAHFYREEGSGYILTSHARSSRKLAIKGSPNVLLLPSKYGYQPSPGLPWDLWVFKL